MDLLYCTGLTSLDDIIEEEIKQAQEEEEEDEVVQGIMAVF